AQVGHPLQMHEPQVVSRYFNALSRFTPWELLCPRQNRVLEVPHKSRTVGSIAHGQSLFGVDEVSLVILFPRSHEERTLDATVLKGK
ncbi:hypothetical protein PFISCL1PPCAC_11463, partial [Pristionchus fissidentatus]